MKKTFVFLFLFLVVLYGKQGYEFFTSNVVNACLLSGNLSDIAEEVIAIPLQKSKEYNIRNAKHIRQEGDNLFLVCNETIYRFNRKGEFMNAITNPEEIKVGGYIIDKRKQELIAFGNDNDIHYYTFSGELVETKKLKNNLSGDRVYSMTMRGEQIWTAEESVTYNSDTNQIKMEVSAVKYDTSFTELERKRIVSADMGREKSITTCQNAELCINKDTGDIYLYNPPLSPEYLLSDTLYLRHHYALKNPDCITMYPMRMGSRFWLAMTEHNPEPLQNYLFCYDTYTNKVWQLTDGFDDNYYGTGTIKHLYAMDNYNQHYYYCKSGAEVSKSFPEEKDDLIVFIVKLKA
ncbi:6-bladed beta-propeller [Massilibacteroides sp.]|uniref:6-bladed beta-propeller n=1 Tax=Massilibacteroides sp. TaxID=2034766 RepID=UPI0026374722|nr:6-bladed beta-propeller [Massilibacteroides sp.]MDD4514087.1 6-bladed beta-propeller [Massilibacteroides sp.]